MTGVAITQKKVPVFAAVETLITVKTDDRFVLYTGLGLGLLFKDFPGPFLSM